jgi:hypothetical protein
VFLLWPSALSSSVLTSVGRSIKDLLWTAAQWLMQAVLLRSPVID